MDTAAVHALEHLGATFLRNDEEWGEKVIYFLKANINSSIFLLHILKIYYII